MARRKQRDIEEAIVDNKRKTNGFDQAKVQAYVDRIEDLHAQIASIMGAAMSQCRAVHGDIKVVLDEAKDSDGIPKKALRFVIKARALERKADEVRDKLEGDDQESYDQIRLALGDLMGTPLADAVTRDFDAPQTANAPFSAA